VCEFEKVLELASLKGSLRHVIGECHISKLVYRFQNDLIQLGLGIIGVLSPYMAMQVSRKEAAGCNAVMQ